MRRVNKLTYNPNSPELHLLIEMLYRGRRFFKGKLYDVAALNVHIPLPVQAVLVRVLNGNGAKKVGAKVFVFDILCVPAYENRIVISHPRYAIYDNEPMVIIELGTSDNYPTYKEIN